MRSTAWLALLLVVACHQVEAEPRAQRVVLVSIDGLRPEFYQDRSWPAPVLQQMAREGVSAARVLSVYPSLTYPAHTTIVTGALPKQHGIFYNRPFEPDGASGRWYWEAEPILVPSLWDALRRAELSCAALNWPVSVGAPVDWLIPEVWSADPKADPIAVIRAASRPADLWQQVEREATGRLTADNFTIKSWTTRDANIGRAAGYVLRTHRPALTAVHLSSADAMQHAFGREHPKVREAVAVVDRALGQLVETARLADLLEGTAFVITGDHGFVSVSSELAPNVWLVEAGLREEGAGRGAWRATFHAEGGSAFLHLKGDDKQKTLELVRRLLSELPEDVRELFRVVDRDEMAELGADPNAALSLTARPGVAFISAADGPTLRPGKGGQHGYHPDALPQIHTGFVGWGAGFKPGATVEQLRLTDMAPLVAELLGLGFKAPDGQSPSQLLSSGR